MVKATKPTLLKPDSIRHDGGTQPRACMDEDLIADYADSYRDNDPLPPLEVFYDGVAYWLADGFHRFFGAIKAEQKKVECTIHRGTLRDAIMFSVGANASHGKRRTNADKRKAVMTLLADSEWVKMTDNAIAKACRVTNHLVTDIRSEIPPKTEVQLSARLENSNVENAESPEKTRVSRGETSKETTPRQENTTVSEPTKRTGSDGKQYPAATPSKPKDEKPSKKEGTQADTTKAQVKLWYDTIARWLGQSPSIDEYMALFPGKPGYRALHAAKELYEALKAWHGAIK